MRVSTMLIVSAVAVAISIGVYHATGGHVIFFALPLLFGLPLLRRRPR